MGKEFVAKFSVQPTPQMTATFTMPKGGGIKDHNKLDNRDIPDQHPISAITELTETLSSINSSLEGKVSTSTTINNKPLSSDVTLNASDVGALPSSTIIPSVNNATITIQKNSVTVDSFTANQSTNKTINISVPTTVAELSDNSDYMKKPTVTTITDTTYSLAVVENTIYEFSNAVTSLTISSAVKSYLESMIYFTTGSSITFTDNSTLKWGGGSVPTTLETNTTYCIAIKNGLAEIDKFGR